MRKRRHLAFTISVAILFGGRTVATSAKDFPCSALRKAKAARLISILGTLPNANLDFSHGTGCYGEEEDEDSPKECDWKVAINEDRNIADDRRLIVVDSDHMTGSGEWTYVLVLGCRAGRVTALFHDVSLYGVDVEEASADKLVLKSLEWVGSDARCCPSMEERNVYVWSKDAQKYELDREYSTPRAKP
jgi:hypothetical protein